MSTAIRVPVQSDALEKLEAMQERAKAVRAALQDVQRDMMAVGRAGLSVSQEQTQRFKALQIERSKLDKLVADARKEEKRQKEQGGPLIERGTIHNIKDVKELLEGNFSARNLHGALELAAETSIGKMLRIPTVVRSLTNVMPIAMVASQVTEAVIDRVREHFEDQRKEAAAALKKSDVMKSLGIDPEAAKVIEQLGSEGTKKAKLVKTEADILNEQRRKEAHGRFFNYFYSKEIKDAKQEAEEEGQLALAEAVSKARDPRALEALGVNIDTIKTMAGDSPFRQASASDFMRQLDSFLAKRLTDPGGMQAMEKALEKNEDLKKFEDEKRAKEQWRKIDVSFDFSERQHEQLTATIHDIQRKRFNPCPTD